MHMNSKVVNSNPAHDEVQYFVILSLSVTCDRFSPGTPISSTNKTDRRDITEISLKRVLKTISLNPYSIYTVLVNIVLGRYHSVEVLLFRRSSDA